MSNGGIEGPAGMVLVNAEATKLAGDSDRRPPVVDELVRTDRPIRQLLSAVLPQLSDEFLDSAAMFEECDSGKAVIAELRQLVADGIRSGRAPELELRTAAGDQYSLEAGPDRIVVFVPAAHVCKNDPPPA